MCAQDTALQQHAERLQSALDMARKIQRNEETSLKDRMEMVGPYCTYCVLDPLWTRIVECHALLAGTFP